MSLQSKTLDDLTASGVEVKSFKVDGKKILAGVFYELKGGKAVKVE